MIPHYDHMTPEETAQFIAKRKSRNIALGLFLGALVVLFFVMTLVKIAK
jgi:hypothetical protein